MRRTLCLCTLVPAALTLAGCWQSGTSYPLPSAEVRERLRSAEAPLTTFGQSAADSVTLEQGDDTIVWAIVDDEDREMIRLVARMVPEGQTTRVTADIAPPEGARHDAVAKGLAANASIASFYRAVAAEQVDSALNKRDFDLTRTYGPMMAATLANLPRMRRTFDEDAAASAKTERENTQRAYDDEASGRWPSTRSGGSDSRRFGDPMDEAAPR